MDIVPYSKGNSEYPVFVYKVMQNKRSWRQQQSFLLDKKYNSITQYKRKYSNIVQNISLSVLYWKWNGNGFSFLF
jgi:hypothetical protein